MTSPTEIRERLAAAGLRVKPPEIRCHSRNGWTAWAVGGAFGFVVGKTEAEARAACQAHHEAHVLALLELDPLDEITAIAQENGMYEPKTGTNVPKSEVE